MESFRAAKSIIERQVTQERRHYPYHVAENYEAFYNAYAHDLHPSEVKEVRRAAETILRRINELADDRRSHRYVRLCRDAIQRIVAGSGDRGADAAAT
jgi:hypothetical protein